MQKCLSQSQKTVLHMYLLLYGGQQVFKDCQLGHKVLQLLVSTLIYTLMKKQNKKNYLKSYLKNITT